MRTNDTLTAEQTRALLSVAIENGAFSARWLRTESPMQIRRRDALRRFYRRVNKDLVSAAEDILMRHRGIEDVLLRRCEKPLSVYSHFGISLLQSHLRVLVQTVSICCFVYLTWGETRPPCLASTHQYRLIE